MSRHQYSLARKQVQAKVMDNSETVEGRTSILDYKSRMQVKMLLLVDKYYEENWKPVIV